MFSRNCANTYYDSSSSGLLVKTIYIRAKFLQMHTCNDYDTERLTVTRE